MIRQKDGWALEKVPATYRDREMCLNAVQESGNSLRYVPDIFRDLEICLAGAFFLSHWLHLATWAHDMR